VLGRVNYEMFASYGPTATGDDKRFADKLNALDKIVFSRRSTVLLGVHWKGDGPQRRSG
jgi:hypothetical protein